MRILVTNDDGIESPGLHALARAAAEAGTAVTVAAPAAEASGTGAGLTAAQDHRRVLTEPRSLPGLDVPAFAVAAHPGLIAMAGCQGAFGEVPDLLLSGINLGANTGRAVVHSGTVGAALTASVLGFRALAVSLDVRFGHSTSPRWDTAAAITADAVALLLDCPPGTVLNVNVPDVAPGRVRGVRWAALAEFGSVRGAIQRLDDGSIKVTTVRVDADLEPGTDAALLADGYVTVTAVRSVAEDDRAHGRANGWIG
ncbi:5'/3'-nucleotidase SurE [Actinokineospora terrae]|uniref:5'-nucleotidase n=1 Tax=Actinokineospora terrae TaxID=155974 RepID=A0A1H9XNE7_9PSEU|nr:5'/3'-nucleotidase SurE [Actinokineospora terrae]SES47539.1 5'-nucleotidase [Actinokineospora terrae]